MRLISKVIVLVSIFRMKEAPAAEDSNDTNERPKCPTINIIKLAHD
jgi:hypothetical protein